MYEIENDFCQVKVNDIGAELSSFVLKKNGEEYMWQGNPDVWSGRSPVLFPIIGRLVNDEYIFEGKTYRMAKHGFVRHAQFKVLEHSNDTLIFTYSGNEETLSVYPFNFSLDIIYRLDNEKLLISYCVKNNGEKPMPYSIGAHPAFRCEIGDTVKFEVPETLNVYRHNNESLLSDDICFPFLNDEDTVVITKDIFLEDAVILEDIKSTSLVLNCKDGRSVTISFGKIPALGIWAKPGAPFVCLEPWHGIDDFLEQHGDITKKRKNRTLEPNSSFSFDFSIVCK